jgi:hypothetical protein
MKTVLSVLCWLGIVVMLTGCNNGEDSSGSAGGRGDWPVVSFTVDNNGNVTCYGADSNVITTKQICTWNCAYYDVNNSGNAPRKVVLRFDEALVCQATGTETVTDPDTNEEITQVVETCENEVALVKEDFYYCEI